MGLARKAGKLEAIFFSEMKILLCDQRPKHFEGILKDAFQLDQFAARIKACFEPAQIEQVIDESGDALYTGLNAPHKFLLLFVERPDTRNKLGITQHGSQRRTQIMGNGMDEFAFDLVQFFEISNIMQSNGRADMRDGSLLCVENPPIIEIHFVILDGAFR